MKIIPVEQGTKEWHDYRRMRIGASDVSAIMGKNPYKTALQLWQEKLMGSENITNAAMKRGHELEIVVRQTYNDLHESYYEPIVVEHPTISFLFASLDGYDEKRISSLIEIKNLSKESHEKAREGFIHEYYKIQMQTQMLVTGSATCLYLSHYDGEILELFLMEDKDIQNDILNACLYFYQMMINCIEPDACDQDIEVFDDSDSIQDALDYLELKDDLSILQAKIEKQKEKLISRASRSRAKIGNLNISKVIRKGNIQYDKIESLKGIDLDAYRKDAITSWRIS